MDSSLSNSKKQTWLFLIVFFGIFVLQVWKSFRGMGPIDEHFYISMGYRFVKGDALFYDEWHITQLISLFLAPFIWLFIKITGSMNGIVHFFRILYVIFTAGCGLAIYYRFRDRGYFAILASAVFMLFTPFNIMTLSYNTMSIGFLVLSLCIYGSNNKIRAAAAGLLYAWAVLNTPYLAILYIVFTAISLIKRKDQRSLNWLAFSSGILIAVIVFFVAVFSRETVSQLLEGLPHLVDKGHADSVIMLMVKGAGKLFQAFHIFLLLFLAEAIAACLFKNKESKKKEFLLIGSMMLNLISAVYIVFISPYLLELGGHALVLFPFAWTGLITLILYPKEWNSWESLCFAVSVIHAVLVAVSSNVGPRSFCSMLITACAMTVMLVSRHVSEWKWSLIPTLGFGLILLFSKVTNLYDASESINTRINDGPLAGLYDSAEQVRTYDALLKDVQTINALPEKNAMFITYNAWEYLACDKRVSTNSAYINPGFEEEWIQNQEEYYRMHRDKYPAYVYLDRTNTPYDLNGSELFFSKMEKLNSLNAGILYLRK